MQMRRLRKQVAYALLFASFWVLVIGGPMLLVSSRNVRPTPTPAPTTPLQPIEIQSIDAVEHGGTVDLVARLFNPNARAGVAHYPVTFVLWGAGDRELARVPVNSHILPGSLQYIATLNVQVPTSVAKVTLITPPDPTFVNLSTTITLPSFSTFLLERQATRRGGNSVTEQKGVVTNNSAFDWQYVEVVALAFDETNKVVGIGTTFVGRLTSGEQREFTVEWPAPTIATARVVTLATTNIFKEDNIIRAVGDPAQLR